MGADSYAIRGLPSGLVIHDLGLMLHYLVSLARYDCVVLIPMESYGYSSARVASPRLAAVATHRSIPDGDSKFEARKIRGSKIRLALSPSVVTFRRASRLAPGCDDRAAFLRRLPDGAVLSEIRLAEPVGDLARVVPLPERRSLEAGRERRHVAGRIPLPPSLRNTPSTCSPQRAGPCRPTGCGTRRHPVLTSCPARPSGYETGAGGMGASRPFAGLLAFVAAVLVGGCSDEVANARDPSCSVASPPSPCPQEEEPVVKQDGSSSGCHAPPAGVGHGRHGTPGRNRSLPAEGICLTVI